jgi:hypothetical protein
MHRGQPAPIVQRPGTISAIDPADAVAVFDNTRRPAPDRAWLHARRPIARAVKRRQYQRIAAIRLHPIAGFDRDQ